VPRLRGVRGAARHHDPSGRLPPRFHAAPGARAGAASARLPVDLARGGGGTVVTLKPRTPSGRAAARVPTARRQDWLDALDFRRIVEPGAAQMAAAADLEDRARAQLEKAHAD